MSATRVTTDDLDFAARWLRSYEGGENGFSIAGQDPADDDAEQAALRRVAAWIETEARRREDAAAERALISKVAADSGVPTTDPRVRTAVRKALIRNREDATKETAQ